jgi:hypothetical protein
LKPRCDERHRDAVRPVLAWLGIVQSKGVLVSKIPGNHNSLPLSDTRAPLTNEGREKRANLMHRHKRVASLTTGKVKTTEAPS